MYYAFIFRWAQELILTHEISDLHHPWLALSDMVMILMFDG